MRFTCEGTLKSVLEKFKKEFLSSLDDDTLNTVVRLEISTGGDSAGDSPAGPAEANELDSLRDELMDIIEKNK